MVKLFNVALPKFIIPPPPPAELLLMVELFAINVPVLASPPLAFVAVFPLIVELVSVMEASPNVSIPPPVLNDELFLIVELITVVVLPGSALIPPPLLTAVLSRIVTLLTVRLPKFKIPPPKPKKKPLPKPLAMVRALIVAIALPATPNTRMVLLPEMVNLPAPVPLIVNVPRLKMTNSPPLSGIVYGALKIAASNSMTSLTKFAFAAAIAPRSVQSAGAAVQKEPGESSLRSTVKVSACVEAVRNKPAKMASSANFMFVIFFIMFVNFLIVFSFLSPKCSSYKGLFLFFLQLFFLQSVLSTKCAAKSLVSYGKT